MKKEYLSRRDSIILSAIEIIDEVGIQELSTREIAIRQGVSEPALYRHFKSKNDILLGIIDYYCSFDSMIINTIVSKGLNARDGIRFFAKSYGENYENNPPLSSVMFAMDAYKYDANVSIKYREVLRNRHEFIIKLIENDIKKGLIKTKLSASDIGDIIIGTMRMKIFRWRASDYNFNLKESIMMTMDEMLKVW